MSDTPNHLNSGESASFDSALSERLWRRATEPLGMIDVRYAEEKYFRIVRWLGRCTALLDHLSRRYGVEEARAYGERPFADQRQGAQLNISNTIQTFLSAGLSPVSLPGGEAQTNALQSLPRETEQEIRQETWKDIRPSGLADILAERSTNPAVKPSSEGRFRISRRPPARLLESDAPQTSRPPATPMGEAKGDIVVERSAPITQQMPFRNRINGEDTATVARITSVDGPPVTPATANESVAATSSNRLTQRRKGPQSPQIIVQREAPGESRAQERPAGDAVKNRREDASASSRLRSLPLVTPTIVQPRTERVPLVLREQEADQRIASSRMQETRSAELSGGGQSRPNEFPPVESTPFAKRDARNDSPPSYQAQGRELQVEDISPRVIRSISERVMRAITLDVKLERERRGVTKWR